MVFRRLIELHSRSRARWASLEVIALSAFAHAAIIGPAYLASRVRVPAPAAPTDEMTMVQFLFPKEQIEGSRPQREQISWVSVATTIGEGFVPEVKKDKERIEMAVAKGDSVQEEKGDAPPAPQPPIALGDSIKTELEVDSAVVRYEDSAAPPYPASMLKKRIEGMVIVQYVVDTTGHADTATFRVLSATHNDFARTVRSTLPLMRFHPAVMGNHRVPQLVEQPFVFKIVDSVRTTREPSKRPPL